MYNLESVIAFIKNDILSVLEDLVKENLLSGEINKNFEIEIPADREHGDLSSNVAFVSAKTFKMAPRKIADLIVEKLNLNGELLSKKVVKNIEVAGAGFINFFLDTCFFTNTLKEINNLKENYGNSDYGKNKKIMVEFVSANPTGPMHMGNARLGALGDCLAAILKKTGYDVFKEFYVNDAGNQIEKFGMSLDVRYRQICEGENSVEMPEDCYQGQDITDLAKEFFEINGDKYIKSSFEERKKALVDFALPKNINRMKEDMKKYKIIYDNWFYESTLHESGEVKRIIDLLTKNGYTYEKDGCLWYKSTAFGSEKDDVLVRKKGIPPFFAADIAYHYNKFITRKFDTCIDILGADHHGHVERTKGSMEALGISRDRLYVLLVQMVRLLKNGELVRMSKRTGKAVQLSDLIDEVGADAARFIFNMHEAKSGMDFDLDLAVKQDSQNPVYYVQYAHARICSIFRQAKAMNKNFDPDSNVNLDLLTSESEKKLIFFMATYPQELLQASIDYDPTKITKFVISLANLFHKFYSSCKVISDDKELTNARLFLCGAVRIIIKNILDMFEVDAPEVMN